MRRSMSRHATRGSSACGLIRAPTKVAAGLISPSQTTTVFVIEAKGKVMVLMTVQRQDSPAADVAALQQILNSVEFQP